MSNIEIKPTASNDVPALETVLDGTGLFPSEMLHDMLAGFLGGSSEDIWLTCHLRDQAVGFCYAVPEQLTEGTWNMLALAVLPAHQGSGCGAALVTHLEALLRERGQRILIVDTSGSDDFVATRGFYKRIGYTEEARIRDFWAQGDDKVTFWKRLS